MHHIRSRNYFFPIVSTSTLLVIVHWGILYCTMPNYLVDCRWVRETRTLHYTPTGPQCHVDLIRSPAARSMCTLYAGTLLGLGSRSVWCNMWSNISTIKEKGYWGTQKFLALHTHPSLAKGPYCFWTSETRHGQMYRTIAQRVRRTVAT